MLRLLTRLLTISIAFLAVLGILIASLPYLISTSWGTQQTVRLVNSVIPGKLEIRQLNLRWTNGQQIEGLFLKDVEGKPVIEWESFSTDATLWQLLNRRIAVGQTKVQNLKTTIVAEKTRWDNFHIALGILPNQTSETSSLVFTQVNGDMSRRGDGTLSGLLEGIVQNDDKEGSFELDFLLDRLQATNLEELKKELPSHCYKEGNALHLHLNNFPVAFIDNCFFFNNPRFKEIFSAFFGNRIEMVFAKESDPQGSFLFKIDAPQVQTEIKGSLLNGSLTISEETVCSLDLTPQFLNAVNKKVQLEGAVPVKLHLNHLSIPLISFENNNTLALSPYGFKMDLAVINSDVRIKGIGTANVEQMSVYLDSAKEDSTIFFHLKGYAEFYKKPLRINYMRKLPKPPSFSSLLKYFDKKR